MLSRDDISVVHTLLGEDLETCGFLYPSKEITESSDLHPNYLILYIDQIGEEKDGRSICRHSKYTEYIFHTHPKFSKGYPSSHDILKVIKRRGNPSSGTSFYPRVSVIFSAWGIWEITARKKRDLATDPRIELWAIDIINEEFEPVYRLTEKGRGKLTGESYREIREAIHNIENILNRKLKCDLRVIFTTWGEVENKGYYLRL